MPQFDYQNPNTGEVKTIIQSVNDVHEYSENGVKWTRIFSVPNAAIDSKIDIHNPKEFARKSMNKRGNIGDLLSAALEASEKRKKEIGKDTMKEAALSQWSKMRNGKTPPPWMTGE